MSNRLKKTVVFGLIALIGSTLFVFPFGSIRIRTVPVGFAMNDLWNAISDGESLESIREIIRLNPQMVFEGNYYFGKPIDCALHQDRADVVALLIENGQDPNEFLLTASAARYMSDSNEFRWSREDETTRPLHYAVERESLTLTITLLEHGADPVLENCDGETPLDIAKVCRNKEILEALERYEMRRNAAGD